jgi:hypothetical protein
MYQALLNSPPVWQLPGATSNVLPVPAGESFSSYIKLQTEVAELQSLCAISCTLVMNKNVMTVQNFMLNSMTMLI